MKILIDIEGTLADIHRVIVRDYNIKHKTSYSIHSITDWDLSEFPLTKKRFLKKVDKLWQERWSKIPPTEGSLRAKLTRISEYNHVDLGTNNGKNLSSMLMWQKKNLGTTFKVIGFAGKYNKLMVADYYDIFIDDEPGLAEQLTELGKQLLLYDRPWNRNIKDSKYVQRIYSFTDVIRPIWSR